MSCLEHVIISCSTNNINQDSPFDIAECLIEIGNYFQERSLNIKMLFLAYFFEIIVGLSAELLAKSES